MTPDYEALAAVLRAFGNTPPGGLYTTTYLCDRSGLSADEFAGIVGTMRNRGWVTDGSFPGETFRLVGRGPDLIGKNGAQLLALDFAAWIKRNGKESFLVREVPDALRHDRVLFELAVRDLVRANAVGPRSGGPISDDTELVVQLDLRVYEFGAVAPLTTVQIQQHVGDVVGRDKNVSTGSGPIVTGDNSIVSIDSEAARRLGELVELLRVRNEAQGAALDLLRDAARPDVSRHEVVGVVADAAEKDPRVIDKLKAWAASVPGHLVKSAIVEGIKQYLRVKGLLQ